MRTRSGRTLVLGPGWGPKKTQINAKWSLNSQRVASVLVAGANGRGGAEAVQVWIGGTQEQRNGMEQQCLERVDRAAGVAVGEGICSCL